MTETSPEFEPEPQGQTARDAGLALGDEGVPDLQDGRPGAEWAEDPEFMPVPNEQPEASIDFGTTSAEQAEGEPLTQRLARELPDDAPGERRAGDPDYAVMQLAPDEDDESAGSASPAVGGEGPEDDAMHVTDG